MFRNRQGKDLAHERHSLFKCGSTKLDSSDLVLDGLYFYLMSVLAKTNGHPITIFIIIDHDNDNTVKGGSERLVETNEEVMTEGRNTLVI